MDRKYIDQTVITCTPAICETSVKRIDEDICGYVSFINIVEVKEKGYITSYDGSKICFADKGYQRLIFLPDGQHWCLTAIYALNKKIIEWYIDITNKNYVDENGQPCYDDLYLDIVIMPDGQITVLDEDELKSALDSGEITQSEYELAYKTYNELTEKNIISCEYLEALCNRLFNLFNSNL